MRKITVQLESHTVDAVLVNENHAIFIEDNTIWFVGLIPADTSNHFKRDVNGAYEMLAEDIVVIDENETLQEVKKALNEITLLEYLTKYCEHNEDYNFSLIKNGEGKLK